MFISRKSRILRSPLWNFFTPSLNDETAICNICKHKLSYKTTTSNLKKHMHKRHPTVSIDGIKPQSFLNKNDEEIESDDEVTAIRAPKKPYEPAITAKLHCIRHENDNSAPMDIEQPSIPGPSGCETNQAVSVLKKQIGNKRTGESLHQQTLSAYAPKKMSMSQKAKIDNAFTKLFTKDFQPYTIVDDEGFIEYSKALNPSYVLPCRKTVSKTLIPAKFEECLANTKGMIDKALSVSLTTDCWTSRNSESFMAVTAHFIDDNFKLQSVVLQCEQFPERHTGENLAQALKDVAKTWGITGKIVLVVSDNASNITKAVNIMQLKHLGCYAHSLNLVVKEALKVNKNIDELLDKMRTIVSHFKRSCNSAEKLLNYQKKNNDPKNAPKKLVQDVSTRWNSTFLMLRRFILLHEPLKATMALIDKDLPILSANEWKMACELMICLKPFFTITESVSGEKYATASLMIPLSNSLLLVCEKLNNKSFSENVHNVASCLLKCVTDRFSLYENSQTLTLVTFLDPRFKNLCFSSLEIGEQVKQRVIKLVTSQITISNQVDQSYSASESNVTSEKDKTIDELSVFSSLDEFLSKKPKKGTNTSRAIVEVDRYLEDENLERKGDPLQWWKTEGQQYPHMRTLFKKYFCCQATSVPCERIFSKAGNFITERRSRLSGNQAKMLIFLNHNLTSIKHNKRQEKDNEIKKNNAYNEEEYLSEIFIKLTED